MRFEIEVNPIPRGGSGKNGPPNQEIICLHVPGVVFVVKTPTQPQHNLT